MNFLNKLIQATLFFSVIGGVAFAIGLRAHNTALRKQYTVEDTAHLFALINQERVRAGVPALLASETLQTAADTRCSALVNNNMYSHEFPVGYDAKTVITTSEPEAKIWAENLTEGENSPEEAVQQWLSSPEHKANMLNPNLNAQGVSICHTDNFLYEGYSSYIFVEDLAQV